MGSFFFVAVAAVMSMGLGLVLGDNSSPARGFWEERDEGVSGNSRKLLQFQGEERISGGKTAPEGRFPYMFSLRSTMGVHKCGALLVHPRFCLTSAHCVHPRIQTSVKLNGLLAIGAHDSLSDDTTPGVQVVRVKRTYIHPDFDPDSIYNGNDLALLELPEASTVTPVPLPDPNYYPVPGDFLLALGWGLGASSSLLQQTFLQASGTDECRRHWVDKGVKANLFGLTFICAQNPSSDTCKGDSGGPLLIPHIRGNNVSAGRPDLDTLVALTSFGDPDCANYEVPGVYTLLGPFVDWIEEITLNSVHMAAGNKKDDKPCSSQSIQPKEKLVLSPVKFTFGLVKLKVPSTCGDFQYDDFQKCASDLGETDGCCEEECVEFLTAVTGRCWEDMETAICSQKSNQSAIMLDLLVNRCDQNKPSVYCTQKCDDRLVEPKSLAISSFNFTLALGRLDVPKSCGSFKFENLESCSEELGVRRGCCSEKCTKVLGEISDQCWSDLEDIVCDLESRKTSIMLDLLSRRCDVWRREIICPQKCGIRLMCEKKGQELLTAAKDGDVVRIKELLAEGVSPRVIDVDNYHRTPLYWAAKQGDLEIVEALLRTGAKVDARSSDGWTPLITAASNNHLDVVRVLIRAGADKNAQTNIGLTALMVAADRGHLRVVKYLVAIDVDINAKNESGETALSFAANSSIRKFLISNGADD